MCKVEYGRNHAEHSKILVEYSRDLEASGRNLEESGSKSGKNLEESSKNMIAICNLIAIETTVKWKNKRQSDDFKKNRKIAGINFKIRYFCQFSLVRVD